LKKLLLAVVLAVAGILFVSPGTVLASWPTEIHTTDTCDRPIQERYWTVYGTAVPRLSLHNEILVTFDDGSTYLHRYPRGGYLPEMHYEWYIRASSFPGRKIVDVLGHVRDGWDGDFYVANGPECP